MWQGLSHLCEGGFLTISYGALAGAFGGLNVTLAKAIFSILVDITERGFHAILSSWVTWVLVVMVIVTYIIELRLTVFGLEQVRSHGPGRNMSL